MLEEDPLPNLIWKLGCLSAKTISYRGVIRKDPLKFREDKLTALEARGQMLVFDVKQVRRKTLDGNYPHQFFSN